MSGPRDNPADTMQVKVDDMTCGHCASTIKTAVESAVPGVVVSANPDSKLVTVKGAAPDAVEQARIFAAITEAGYTPKLAS